MPVPCGSPPCTMKFGITRWKIVPSYRRSVLFLPVLGCRHSRLPSARSVKFCTVLGASFSKRRQTMVPSEVVKIAYVPDCRAMDYLSEMDFVRSGRMDILNGSRDLDFGVWSFAPSGLTQFPDSPHGLRRGL